MRKEQGAQEATKERLAKSSSQRDSYYEEEFACKHDHPCELDKI